MSDYEPSENPFASPQITEAMTIESSSREYGIGEELPSRWLRLGAALLDLLIMMPAIIILIFVFLRLGTSWQRDPLLAALIAVGSIVLGQVLFLAVHGYLLAKYGQTVGKYVCGLRIVRYQDRQLASLMHLMLLRYLPITLLGKIPQVGFIFGIVNVLMIFNKEKRCLHDYIAGTIVVKA